MIRLDQDQIQFIDNYLNYANVVHVDIRTEMIDHVASGIEAIINEGDTRDFYFIFKDYMIVHKARLLDNNKKFIKSSEKKLIKGILKEFVKWPCIITFLILLCLFKYLNVTSEISVLKTWFGLLPLTTFVLFGIAYFMALRFYKLGRFASLERLGFIFAMSFQLFHFCWNIAHLEVMKGFEYITIGLVSLTLTLLLAMALVAVKQMKYYQNQYKILE